MGGAWIVHCVMHHMVWNTLADCDVLHLYLVCGRTTALKEAFSALMTADSSDVTAAAGRLVARLSRQRDEGTSPLSQTEQLVLILNQQYPDVRITSFSTADTPRMSYLANSPPDVRWCGVA